MRRWRPFPVVLALLSLACTERASESASEERTEAMHWTPCGRTASLLGQGGGGEDAQPQDLRHGDRVLLFTVDDGVHGREPWTSTGTQGAGTALLKDVNPGPEGSEPSAGIRVGDKLFFVADDGEHGRELWVTDGSPRGTRMVKDLWAGPDGSFPRSLAAFKNQVYFAAGDTEHGRELWRSDGTADGTMLVQDLDPGPEGTSPDLLTRGGDGALYFVAHLGGFFTVLMRSTGGADAAEVARVAGEGGVLESLTPVGRRLFFVMGEIHDHAMALMVTEGGAPKRVGAFTEPRELVAMGGKLYFVGGTEHAPGDAELWRSDGSSQGTKRVKDVRSGPEGASPAGLQAVGRRLFFSADDGVHGRELWVSDGASTGTRLVVDLEPGEAGSSPDALVAAEGSVFFSAERSGHGREPWVSDGTAGGTAQLGDLARGERSSDPTGFTRSGWDVFFVAGDDSGGRGLWAMPFRPEGRCDAVAR